MKSVYLATVQLAIEADDDQQALEAVSAMLTDNLVPSKAVIDWQFMQDEQGAFQYPIYVGKYKERELGFQFIETMLSYLADGYIYRIPKVTSTKLELLQMGKHRFIQHFLINAYHSSFGKLRGFNQWKKTDEAIYNERFNFALDLYDNIVKNAGNTESKSLLASCSIGIVCVQEVYFVQIILGENKHQYYCRTTPMVAYALAQKEGITIEDSDTMPSGVYLTK